MHAETWTLPQEMNRFVLINRGEMEQPRGKTEIVGHENREV